ncbi:hypothetical protein ISF9_078 [Microbacterium phage vB_MoxS-ISF9]|uniref:Uncharacterized protein n=1 Tax=Microbacterium phage vB_MoxS-ISF9 TaxID=1458670 RepID=W8NWP1_9CAUD|nr:hypothetical protein ISF9_078 [Microbacterium phage vB_MoxS-ISF9]AHL18548.1 hypothetical protein ISF9_078 [Microbacterium phage vB_MoxS-ISF9]
MSLLEEARDLIGRMSEQIRVEQAKKEPVRDGIYVNTVHGHVIRVALGKAMIMDHLTRRVTDGGPAVLYENGIREGNLRLVCDLKGNPVE